MVQQSRSFLVHRDIQIGSNDRLRGRHLPPNGVRLPYLQQDAHDTKQIECKAY